MSRARFAQEMALLIQLKTFRPVNHDMVDALSWMFPTRWQRFKRWVKRMFRALLAYLEEGR